MSTTVFINAVKLTKYAYLELPHGESAFQTIINISGKLPDVDKIVVIANKDFSLKGNFRIVRIVGSDMSDLINVFKAEIEESENIFYLYGDTPLINSDLSLRMYKNHNKYFASYTFADGYPYGMAPEILKKTILVQLGTLSERNPMEIDRNSIFELIQKDINSFDIETEISKIDQRMLRVSLAADTKRNFNQLKRIMKNLGTDKIITEEAIINLLETKQELLRIEPSFVNVQICGACPQTCSYCPYPKVAGDVINIKDEMSLDQWGIILSKVKNFSDDAVFSISMWGEPSLHSNILGIINALLEYEKFTLIIETSGIGWKSDVLETLSKISDGRIDWIISMDAQNPTSYRELRGEGWDEANSTALLLKKLFPKNLYIQSVRMKDQEEFLEKFYRSWKERGFNVIIQKHDSFCGFLPDLRVTDLSPVKRFPCWHLKRDLNILLDGRIPLCREDLNADYLQGNIFTDEIPEIWERSKSKYLEHLDQKYPEICRGCDEYYTYNF